MSTSRQRLTGWSPRRHRAFTLIELMVVVAIIAVLVTVTVPAVKSISAAGQLAQAENVVRASLIQARNYAISKGFIAGLRFQDDARVIMIYARNMNSVYDSQSFVNPPVYDMKSVPGYSPAQMPGPYRVTMRDVGCYGAGGCATGDDMRTRWIGPGQSNTSQQYPGPPEFLNEADAWFAHPVVLFNGQGKVIFSECRFRYSTDPDVGWYPTMEGSFAKATDCKGNPNPIPPHPYVRYTNQVALSGWRSNDYKGSGSHDVPVEAPSMTGAPRIFNYVEFRGRKDLREAVEVISNTASDCVLDVNTGMIVRTRAFEKTSSN